MMNIREIAPVPYAQSPGLAIYCFGKGEPIPYNLFSFPQKGGRGGGSCS